MIDPSELAPMVQEALEIGGYLVDGKFENVYDMGDLDGRNGHTAYVDFITPSEMKGPIGVFKDRCSRPGVAIMVNGMMGGKAHHNVLAVFQRYSDTTRTWTYGWGHSQHGLEYSLPQSAMYMNDLPTALKNLFKGKYHWVGMPNTTEPKSKLPSELNDLVAEYANSTDLTY